MRNILITFFLMSSMLLHAQKIGGVFKYATVYTSAFASSPMPAQKEYFVTQGGELQDITIENPFDYKATIGIRRVARYDYENRQNRFYDGQTESTTALSATVGSVKGVEYLAQYDIGRQQGTEYVNQRYFLRYLSKYFMVKGEYYNQGLVDLNYTQVEARTRLHIGELDFSVGLAARQHQPYGYDPIADYLQDKPWWDLAMDYGYSDNYYGIDYDNDGEIDNADWWWQNSEGERVADTDADFRKYIYKDIVNDYNRVMLDSVGALASLSAIAGVDYYHYEDDFWIHSWASILPYHRHIVGGHEFSYQNFVEHDCDEDCDEHNHRGVQWVDYSAGIVFGWKLGKRWGIFTEGEYMKYWDRNIFNLRAGINYQFR